MTDVKTPPKPAGTNGQPKKERKPRQKKATDLKSVADDAALLSFEHKIDLVKALKIQINEEAAVRAKLAQDATKLTEGL